MTPRNEPELAELLARAIAKKRWGWAWEQVADQLKSDVRDEARATIEAERKAGLAVVRPEVIEATIKERLFPLLDQAGQATVSFALTDAIDAGDLIGAER